MTTKKLVLLSIVALQVCLLMLGFHYFVGDYYVSDGPAIKCAPHQTKPLACITVKGLQCCRWPVLIDNFCLEDDECDENELLADMENSLWGTETLCRKVSKLSCTDNMSGWELTTTTPLYNLNDGFPEGGEYNHWQERFIEDHCKKCPECCAYGPDAEDTPIKDGDDGC